VIVGFSVVIRTHASATVGLGHLHRCLALAKALAAGGARVEMWGEGTVAVERAARAGFCARAVDAGALPDHGESEVIIIDGYHYEAAFAAEACRRARVVVTIEDWPLRGLPAHVVVDVGGVAPASTPGDVPGAERLCGPRYALLAEEYAPMPARQWADSIRGVLLTLGGVPDAARLAELTAAIRSTLPDATIDLVLGPFANADRLAVDANVRVHRDLESLHAIMLASDVAISAAGQTMLQLAATATPTIALAVHDNQRAQLATLTAAGAVIEARTGHPEDIVAALTTLRERATRAQLGAVARGVVDGGGAVRVAEVVRRRVRRTLAVA
jgi:spore coat polysaccharide biosynthesis predicted glycosyltransferase SpsG